MNDMRDAFESWLLENVTTRIPQYEPQHGYYLDDSVDDMWQAWKAAFQAGMNVRASQMIQQDKLIGALRAEGEYLRKRIVELRS